MEVEKTLFNETVSPSSRIYLHREMEFSIDCFITFESPVDVAAVKEAIKLLTKICPRLRSVVKEERERHHWKDLTEIEIDNLLVIVPDKAEGHHQGSDSNTYINKYLASLPSMEALTRNCPLWEVHILPRQQCSLVLRLHHALGDCVSLLALFLSSCEASKNELSLSRYARERRESVTFSGLMAKYSANLWSFFKQIKRELTTVFHSKVYKETEKEIMFVLKGRDLESIPRKLSSLVISLDDMKIVKNKINGTINDVLVGIILYGISKYLKSKQCYEILESSLISLLIPVNFRGEGTEDILQALGEGRKIKWGNKAGWISIALSLENNTNNPLEFVYRAKAVIDKKKKSSEAQDSYKSVAKLLNQSGLEALASNNRDLLHNTSLITSNIIGPSNAIKLAGNLITKVGVTLSRAPSAITVHMISYNGKAFIQFLVAEEIIDEPGMLCLCVREGLSEMVTKV